MRTDADAGPNRGQASVEWLGLCVAAVVLAWVVIGGSPAVAADLQGGLERAVCRVTAPISGQSCPGVQRPVGRRDVGDAETPRVLQRRSVRSPRAVTFGASRRRAPIRPAVQGDVARPDDPGSAWCFSKVGSELCASPTGEVTYCPFASCSGRSDAIPVEVFDACADTVGAAPGVRTCRLNGEGVGDYVLRCGTGPTPVCVDPSVALATCEPPTAPRGRGLAAIDDPMAGLPRIVHADGSCDLVPTGHVERGPGDGPITPSAAFTTDRDGRLQAIETRRKPTVEVPELREVSDHADAILETARCALGVAGVDGRGASVRIWAQRDPLEGSSPGFYRPSTGQISLRAGATGAVLAHEINHAMTNRRGLGVFRAPASDRPGAMALDEGFADLFSRVVSQALPPGPATSRLQAREQAEQLRRRRDGVRFGPAYDALGAPDEVYAKGYLAQRIYRALDLMMPPAVAAALQPIDGCAPATTDPMARWWADSLTELAQGDGGPGFVEWCGAMAASAGDYGVESARVRRTFASFGVPCDGSGPALGSGSGLGVRTGDATSPDWVGPDATGSAASLPQPTQPQFVSGSTGSAWGKGVSRATLVAAAVAAIKVVNALGKLKLP